MIIPDRRNLIRFTTVRIEAKNQTSSTLSTASVFTTMSPVGESVSEVHGNTLRGVPFLVTNRHAVEGFDHFTFSFFAGDPSTRISSIDSNPAGPFCGKPLTRTPVTCTLSHIRDKWHFHPDPEVDIAVLPITVLIQALRDRGDSIYVVPIRDSMIPDFATSGINDIEYVYIVGYLEGIIDPINLSPVIRGGVTATPITINYGDKPKFLVDASIFPGSSGSPVFLANGLPIDKPFDLNLYFVGVVASGFSKQQMGTIHSSPLPMHALYEQSIDIGMVIKSTCVREAILDGNKNYTGGPILGKPSGEGK